MMESIYVVGLKNGAVLLLAEMGLHEGNNVTFDENGRQATLSMARFIAESEREIDFDSVELTDAQRIAYSKYWARRESDKGQRDEITRLLMYAERHPLRHGADRRGGGVFRKETYELGHLIERLYTWLKEAVDEDVVGEIGNFGRKVWLRSSVREVNTSMVIPFGIHADTRALGVARFLLFVSRCGGADHVRIRHSGGETVLVSDAGNQNFSTIPYFYWSASH